MFHLNGNFPHRAQPSVYPPIVTGRFMSSARGMNVLLADAGKLGARIAQSPAFARQLMIEAQSAQTPRVYKLLQSAGIISKMEAVYSPDGLRIAFSSDCCRLTVFYSW
ncbi:hypothetical protein LRR81_18335 [Metabacillus sp. GX 13764]|uniref:hypothetical protein n=1 Tax=Metabacillus kandeliae TaxID=2900151 RepID=UPI001E4E3DEA|nr:hypothetical protein [Metabacillus kandeliae]MCD7036205.1 hypothetical protein [Metabacillus kandeliae]